ncbi:MAG: Zn-dependent hydrolase [Candidatus Melainabacteria bacterium HGW-Melainabacteria-1]|nr:MAG: Zn-dependent hydrolase [Candidatus Melainabacteria bacterium HGW-Melainabacteria-1]
MLFRQMFDANTWTYTYLLADEESHDAVLIDTVHEQAARDAKVVKELGLKLKYLLETHIHADHITAVSDLKKIFPEVQSVASRFSGAVCPDLLVVDGDLLLFGPYVIRVLETPGHTSGCVSYQIGDRVFTGDALLIRGCGRTDFQDGDPEKLYDSVTSKLFTLPENTLVYPAHNYVGLTVSSIAEEKKHNPRLAGTSREEFIAMMNALDLPMPTKILESVPANLKCGNLALDVNQDATND